MNDVTMTLPLTTNSSVIDDNKFSMILKEEHDNTNNVQWVVVDKITFDFAKTNSKDMAKIIFNAITNKHNVMVEEQSKYHCEYPGLEDFTEGC